MDGTSSANWTTGDELPLSHRVVTAVADAVDADPLELEPLYDVVDPEALDRIFDHRSSSERLGNGCVSFTMADCDVTIDGTGEIDVTPPVQRTSARVDAAPGSETDVSTTD